MINHVFFIVVSKVVNYVLHIVYFLVLNPRRIIKKISLKARRGK